MKKFLALSVVLVMLTLSLVAFTGCGGGGDGTIVGEWNFVGSLYYTFNEDGTGLLAGVGAIRWSAENGILTICLSPAVCDLLDECSLPQHWDYEVTGNRLRLTGRTGNLLAGQTFTYRRR